MRQNTIAATKKFIIISIISACSFLEKSLSSKCKRNFEILAVRERENKQFLACSWFFCVIFANAKCLDNYIILCQGFLFSCFLFCVLVFPLKKFIIELI